MHKDDFIREEIELTTYTPQDDIMLKLKGQNPIIMMNQSGDLLRIDITKQALEVIRDFKLVKV